MSLRATSSSSFSMTINQNGCSISRTNSGTITLDEQVFAPSNGTFNPQDAQEQVQQTSYMTQQHAVYATNNFQSLQNPLVVNTTNANDRLFVMDANNQLFMLAPTHYSNSYNDVQSNMQTVMTTNNSNPLISDITNGQRQYEGNNQCGFAQPYVLQCNESEDDREDFAEEPARTLPVINETAAGGSDGSTVEDNSSVGPTAGDDATEPSEPMAFLQGLNSGNLMQFSQQSVLHELMQQERIDIKPQINTLPTLENHNNGGYDFGMVLKEPPKSHWMFSEALNKLYIRMNKTFNIDVEFKTKMPIQQLNLRSFLCFVKEVSGPVLRCQNHLSTDPGNPKLRQSLLRCENPVTQYCGTAEGKSIMDRYSVLVPLNMCRPGNGRTVRQTLAFKFACQNSCFGRKETSLVFCLENMRGEILGQQVLHVKICTCPKRDRNQDERHISGQKRKSLAAAASEDEEFDVKGMKMRRLTHTMKEENESNDSSELDTTASLAADWEVKCMPDGRYRLVMECPKKSLLLQNIDGMFEKTAGALLLNAQKPELLRQHANNLLELKKHALKLP